MRARSPLRRRPRRTGSSRSPVSAVLGGVVLFVAVSATLAVLVLRSQYTFSLQSPVRIRFQWPLVAAAKTAGEDALEAQADQFGHRLTAYQQYACNKFGSACRVALAIQRAENPRGACEIYHYNSDGTLDQYRAPDAGRFEPERSAGLQGQHRLRLSAVPGERLPAVEHLQQRGISKVPEGPVVGIHLG